MFRAWDPCDEDTGTVKISDLDGAKHRKLNQAPVHNLNEERSVGFINYELEIRGKKHLESASKKMVLNKSVDLLMDCDSAAVKCFRKPAQAIKELKKEWTSRVQEHQKKGFADKDLSNLKAKSVKYELLECLKKEQYPGPFTTVEEVKLFLESPLEDKIKNNRLYKEIKYARMTCMSLQPTEITAS